MADFRSGGQAGPLVFDGTRERVVYTYDGRPLAGIKTGDRFYAEVARGRVALGGVDTAETPDAVALEFGGVPFGFLFGGPVELREIAETGRRVSLRVEKVGEYDEARGIPDLRAYHAPYSDIRAWRSEHRDDCRFVERPAPSGKKKWPKIGMLALLALCIAACAESCLGI